MHSTDSQHVRSSGNPDAAARGLELRDDEMSSRAAGDNFPVALRVLPAGARDALAAIYAYARLVDETGDRPGSGADEILSALDALEAELDLAMQADPVDSADSARPARGAHPAHATFIRLQGVIATHGLSRAHFAGLIEANRRDQLVTRYASWEELRDYCRLSAEPVGRLVLEVFGCANAQTEPLSDDVCSALQLLEHCQDVAEDLGNGRIYLPADDLARFGCDPATLSAPTASKQLREVIRFQVGRARELLASGSVLVSRLHGAARIAVAGYVAGGLATARAIERCDYDVLANQAGPARRHIVSSWLRLMIAAMFSSSRPRGSRRASTALPGSAA